MKNLFTILFLLCCPFLVFAKPVDLATAKKIGANFLVANTKGSQFKTSDDLQLAYKSSSNPTLNNQDYFYVFNTTSGFVIVSADDNCRPVLGYSNERAFSANNMAPQVAKWLEGYRSQIMYIVTNHVAAGPEISNQWNALLINEPHGAPLQAASSVSPLLTTTWDQSPYYNDNCPYDNTYSQKAVTGCVATAMAQVMKFWNYPSSGADFHSYSDNTYGTQSADFGSTTYDWNSMPNKLTSSNKAVATLMYHCGVSVNMNYGVGKTGGSSAYVISSASPVANCAEYALKTYFGYKSSMNGIKRSDYTDANWITNLENELGAGRPVIYAGFGSGGGHCFVADGYDANNYLHFNWGWAGQNNGYFQIDALNPGTVGTGGGSGGFNSNQQAITGIQPSTTGGTASPYDLRLYDYVTPSATTIYYGNTFSVSTNIVNKGSKDFAGDYCAAIFDNNNTFIDYVGTISNATLPSTYVYTKDITFTYPASFALLPGTYTVGIYYRPSGGKWSIVTDNANYSNSVTINIINPGTLEMYASMSVTPSGTLTIGQSVSVHLDIANTSTTTQFNGTFDVALYNFDGTGAFTIQKRTGMTLDAISHYSSGLTFTNTSLNVKAGTYLLAVTYISDGTSNNYLVGSSKYANPIKVTVQEAPLLPDKYESNDDIAHAYTLSVNYSNNSAAVNTDQSNCHTGSDVDFYKIKLPAGYDYTIKSHLDDSRYTTNGNTYTLDAIFSYSTDAGNTWSATFDDEMPNTLTIKGGGTVYFKVAPYFEGQTGTYLLETAIDRVLSTTGISNQSNAENEIKIYPNPVNDIMHIDAIGFQGNINQVSVTDMAGKELIVERGNSSSGAVAISVNNLPSGLYMVQIQTDKGILTRKITIVR
jgi:hypothetical protein